jgi:hypothetical protein
MDVYLPFPAATPRHATPLDCLDLPAACGCGD